jgi:hypothetical protein
MHLEIRLEENWRLSCLDHLNYILNCYRNPSRRMVPASCCFNMTHTHGIPIAFWCHLLHGIRYGIEPSN